MRTSCNGLSRARRASFPAPAILLLREGDPADALFVLLEGEVRGRRESGARMLPAFRRSAGEVTGLLPFLPHDPLFLDGPGHHALLDVCVCIRTIFRKCCSAFRSCFRGWSA